MNEPAAQRPITVYTRSLIALPIVPEPSKPLTHDLTHPSNEGEEKTAAPRALPQSLFEVCQQLEERGISTWSQGEGLLDDLRPSTSTLPTTTEPRPTRSLLCQANPHELLEILPRAVVTASQARRLTLATEAGPIDLLPIGRGSLEEGLLAFGLSPFAFAYRPTKECWCDPAGARATFDAGVLDISVATPNPFDLAPRRYWIAARLMSERSLEPSPGLLEAARAALPSAIDRLPQAAPARREVSRILASSAPERGLAFLRESGVSPTLFPGMDSAGEARIAHLPPLPALRWAAWLHGSEIQRTLIRLRVPPPLARRIERIHRAHPIDRRVESLREVGIRKILGRLGQDEIDGLFVWRRLELAAAPASEEIRIRSTRLDEIEASFEEVRNHQARSGHIRSLALDGKAVMAALGAGPGPHVGRALAHLANFVEARPDANERESLEQELADWAAKNADAVGRS
jgi:tRNA nucleotidyltransferase (CCA-adding enzyme)